LTKDPEDFHLDHLDFKKVEVPDFDTYLCDEVEPAVNQVVDIVNEINGCINDIKDAAALVLKAFKVDVNLQGAINHDIVVLGLVKAADGAHPPAAEVEKLVADANIAKADKDLLAAKKALHTALESSPVALRVANDLLAADGATAQVEAFNKALTELRTAVTAAGYKVSLVHKPAGAQGATAVRVTISKPVFKSEDSDDYTLEPVSLLDVARTKEAKNIFAAEQAVAEALSGLSKALKAAEEASITTSFELKRKKLVPKIEGGEGDGVADKKSAIRKAVSAVNSQLFKLFKSSRNANGDVTIAKALVVVFESIKKTLVKKVGAEAKSAIKCSPSIKCNDGDFDFDLGLKVNLPDFQDLQWMELVEKLLPGPGKVVFNAIMEVKDKLVEMFPKFKELAEQVEELVKRAEEVFKDMQDKIKESLGEKVNDDPFLVAKVAASAAANLKMVTIDPIKIITTMKDTVLRLNDELQAGVTELKTLFP